MKESEENEESRHKNWFNIDEYNSHMFITSTPNSKLKKKMQNAIDSKRGRIKVIEKGVKK